jgi:nitrogen-specific signal transduction histidine kinase
MIDVFSKPGETTFKILLPINKDAKHGWARKKNMDSWWR